MDSGDWDGDGGGASQHPATGQESRPTRDRPTINSARPRSAPPGQPAEPNVDIVDNVDKRHGQPGQQSGQPDRVRGPIALRDRRPFGGMGQRPPVQARPSNVDIVDIVDRKDGGSGETDLGAALREIDILDGMSAGMPRQPVQDADPSPTRLRNPVPVAPGSGTEPRGPSQDVVAAIRARAKARLGQRAAQAGTLPGAGSQPSKESPSPQARHGLTVSQATLDQYLRRGQQLVDRYRRERDLDVSIHEMSPTEWVNWLLSLKPGLKSSTWRMYRAAASHYLEGLPESAAAVAMLETDVIDRSRTPEAPSADGGKARRTSALKEKRFPVEDFERVVTYLKAFSRSKYAPVLIDWLRSGIFTGLRPSEWRTADLEVIGDPSAAYGRRAYLYVINAKATNDRGTGIARTLDLSAFPDPELDVVKRMVARAREWADQDRYVDVQGECSDLLYSVTAKLWPHRRFAYALYSCRHQAIANWKSMLEPAHIAAIVGHGVTATASEHYGKRRSSWPPDQNSRAAAAGA